MPDIYRKKKNFFEKAEWEWILQPDVLVEKSPAGSERRLPWAEVLHARLVFSPTRSQTWRHYFQVHYRNGSSLEIDNVHFKNFGMCEDRSKDYSPFVLAALHLIAKHSPQAGLTLGLKPWVYAAGLIMMISAVLVLAYAVLMLPMPLGSWAMTALVKSSLILIAVPSLFLWAMRTRPRKASFQAIPQNELP